MQFTQVLDQLGIRYSTEGRGTRAGWLQFTCPVCGSDPYLGFNLWGNYFNCWRCGRLPLSDTLAKLSGRGWQEIKPLIADLDPAKAADGPQRPAGSLKLPKGLGPLQDAHKRYLRNRGLSWRAIERDWGVQGIGLASRLKWRVWIPIHYQGEVVSWTTRAISDKVTTRYISAGPEEESKPHRELVYGADHCQHAIIVHEGPVDVWRTGFGAGCLFGLGYKREQVLALADFAIRVIAFDNEHKAQERARKLCDLLAPFPGQTFRVVLESGKDSAEADAAEVQELRDRFLGHPTWAVNGR